MDPDVVADWKRRIAAINESGGEIIN